MEIIKITKQSAVKSLQRKHPWVFSGAISENVIEHGSLVRLEDGNGNFLGVGYCAADSSIRVRVLSFEDVEVGQDFWNERLVDAYELRKSSIDPSETNCFRLINAEGDYIPGLIVDVYGEYVVLDFHVDALYKFENEIKTAIQNLGFKIFEGDDLAFNVKENGYLFQVTPGKGQKTGLFLDQRENRRRMQKYCKGKRILNMFSYTGAFSIYALKAGAESVVNVDSSEFAMDQAKENYKLNGLEIDESDFVISDAFKFLEDALNNDARFDAVILDPPAFVKHKESIRRALGGYRRLNFLGMKITSEGGILNTYSCSGHISNDQLRTLLWQSANDAMKNVQILENPRNQLDHPIDINCPESEYLKGLILQVS